MGQRLIGDRIPKIQGLEHWAKQKCELCGRELGYEDSIKCGKENMEYQHCSCAIEYAIKNLIKINKNDNIDSIKIIVDETLKKLGAIDG